jgi:two-component sensor histidine kinase
MALIHEKLYQSENLSRIDFQNYLKTLITHLRLSYNGPGTLRYTVAAQGVELDLDTAIACGLIVNELVTNVLKYAFPGNNPRPGSDSCELSVSLERDGSVYTLIVADNGIGLPTNLDPAKTKTIGLMLVRMLGENQLGGTFNIDRTGGTRFALTFSPRRTR